MPWYRRILARWLRSGCSRPTLGTTLWMGVLIAVPTVVIAGPLFGNLAARWVPVSAPDLFTSSDSETSAGIAPRRPGFVITLVTVLLPVVLMMGKALSDVLASEGSGVRVAFDFVGQPMFALLLTALIALFTLGHGSGMTREQISASVGASLPPIAGILLIVAAGGGFKQVLIDTGIGTMLAQSILGSRLSPILLAWAVAVVIRLATGSATRRHGDRGWHPGTGGRRPATHTCRHARAGDRWPGRCSSPTSMTPDSGSSRSTSASRWVRTSRRGP